MRPLQYLHTDALGNLWQVTGASGQVLGNRRYSPFGEIVAGTGNLSPLGFTGEQQDATSGLTYLRARYYHAALGRFLQADTVGGFVPRPSSLNRYTCAENNPATFTDPRGQFPELLFFLLGRISIVCPMSFSVTPLS